MTNQLLILQPLMAMLLIVFVVWLVMFLRHTLYLNAHKIDVQAIAMPEEVGAVFPATVRQAGNNLRNLFELPVVFFVVCLCVFVLVKTDATYVWLAWTYVGLRAIHSIVHCTTNVVKIRFLAWFLSCVILWAMATRLAISIFS